LSQLRVAAAAAHPERAAPRAARPSETGQAVAVSALLAMTFTALALWWPRLPVRHG
jgi:hypothetical protein